MRKLTSFALATLFCFSLHLSAHASSCKKVPENPLAWTKLKQLITKLTTQKTYHWYEYSGAQHALLETLDEIQVDPRLTHVEHGYPETWFDGERTVWRAWVKAMLKKEAFTLADLMLPLEQRIDPCKTISDVSPFLPIGNEMLTAIFENAGNVLVNEHGICYRYGATVTPSRTPSSPINVHLDWIVMNCADSEHPIRD